MRNYSRKPWTNHELNRAVELWCSGATMAEIATALGRGVCSIKGQMARYRDMFPHRITRGREEHPVEYTVYNAHLPKELHGRLRARSKATGVPMNKIIRDALEMVL